MYISFYKESKEIAACKPQFSHFPDGQPHVKIGAYKDIIPTEPDEIKLYCSIRYPAELFNLLMVYEILRRPCAWTRIEVNIYWLFGARMDRPIDDGQPFTFDCVDRILNRIRGWSNTYINVLDLHCRDRFGSNYGSIDISDFYCTALSMIPGNPDIFFPDKGAKTRYSFEFTNYNILFGGKARDSQTGKLSGFRIEGGERQSDTVLIVDDICDGGGTFVGQMKILKELGYEKVYLFVTHGLFTKGFEPLKEFDGIFCTNSFKFGKIDEDGYSANNTLQLLYYSRL